jgi:hypothetical protein
MRIRDIRSDAFRGLELRSGPMLKLSPWAIAIVCLAVSAVIPLIPHVSLAQQSGNVQSPANMHDFSQWPPINPLANRTADANRIMEDSMKSKENQKRLAELNLQRKKEMSEDTDKLLVLANELKTVADKVNKDPISMESVRKAEAIAKLARDVREKMKATVEN